VAIKTPKPKIQKKAPSPNIQKGPPNVKALKGPANPAPARAAAPPPKPPAPAPALRVRKPLPAKSVQKAANAFKNFSLSRFAKASTPANYVPAANAKVPSAVAAVQRKSIVANIATLAAKGPNGPGLGLALPSKQMTLLLPTLDAKAGTVDTTQLLGVLRQRMPGTELYASGNPTLNRVVQHAPRVSHVQARIAANKQGGA
jgi:hypothetical protein